MRRTEAGFVPLPPRPELEEPTEAAARRFYETIQSRRSVRSFSDRPVDSATVEWIVRAAGSAPSGANRQPWRFICIQNPDVKRRIREAAEAEERAFYEGRAGKRWLADLEPLGTGPDKPFLETAPWLIAVFRLTRGPDGEQVYYPMESVGIACGLLLAAIHAAGLASLTHTPSPMGFLGEILERPAWEKPFLLIPIGYPAEDCVVPVAAVQRKPLDEIMTVI